MGHKRLSNGSNDKRRVPPPFAEEGIHQAAGATHFQGGERCRRPTPPHLPRFRWPLFIPHLQSKKLYFRIREWATTGMGGGGRKWISQTVTKRNILSCLSIPPFREAIQPTPRLIVTLSAVTGLCPVLRDVHYSPIKRRKSHPSVFLALSLFQGHSKATCSLLQLTERHTVTWIASQLQGRPDQHNI